MTEQRLKNIISESVHNAIKEIQKEKRVKQIVKENIRNVLLDKMLNEESDNSKRLDIKRKAVMSMLKNDIYDHAPLAYALYDSNDDSEKATARSLFSKKATGTPDADGQVRHFDEKEINKLYELLRTKK